jgi:polyhydroxyalkanoate synthesis repressor PhaR
MAKSSAKVTIKKYANRRLYDTESSAYITLDRLAQMVRENREFEVVDAKTGEDITRQVLTISSSTRNHAAPPCCRSTS